MNSAPTVSVTDELLAEIDMDDRELLELAARADGRVLKWKLGFHQITLPPSVPYFEVGGLIQYWNPLKDDGDALRLAVKLGLDLLIYADGAEALSKTASPILEDAYKDHGMDVCAATRRAIVRAAASIGAAINYEAN